jgi:hypothetical protein
MKWVINNYHNKFEDLKPYIKDDTFICYNKEDKNVGSNIYDYMSYIVDNYDKLDEVTIFCKSNMLERHLSKEEFEILLKKKGFIPLLTENHHTYLPICWYEDGMYCEVNDYWYLLEYPCRNYGACEEVKKMCGFYDRKYNKFSPGGCYIVPKNNILQHPKEFYTKLRDLCSWHETPGEAYLIERSLYHIWS